MPSENGWNPARAASSQCKWIKVPGAQHVSLQLLDGQPLIILRAFAADYHAYIEPLRDPDSAGWTPTNSVPTSNHLNGTAMDLNWQGADGNTFRLGISKERAYPGDRARNLDELLDFYEDVVFCGGYWSIKDWMHFQMGYGSYNSSKTADFIARKIRADGFSTFRRGGVASPPPAPSVSKADGYALEIIAEGRRRNITPRGIQIALSVVQVESNFKMYANRSVPASMSIPHDAVGSDHDSVGLFQQRCPMWGPAHILMDPAKSAGLFYDRLANMDYNNDANSPGWYAAEIQRPAAQYRYRYDERFPEAVELYGRLAGIDSGTTEEDGFVSALSPEEQRALYNEVMSQRKSRSPLRHVGSEWEGDMGDITWNTDGSVHVLITYLSAVILGDPDAIALLREVAGVNTNRYPERLHDSRLAQAMLNLIDDKFTTVSAPKTGETTGAAPAAPVAIPAPPPPAPAPQVYTPTPVAPRQAAQPQALGQAPPSAEGGLLGELLALTTKLQDVSRQVTEITEGESK